ncbi:hypothetical protein MMC27_000254, partial [Xylographa pallens]|nr:hypothetical protein [Xylographa pallens]
MGLVRRPTGRRGVSIYGRLNSPDRSTGRTGLGESVQLGDSTLHPRPELSDQQWICPSRM